MAISEHRFDRDGVRSILIINLGGIGDALLSTPAVRALAAAYPLAAVSVLASASAAEVFRTLPYIKEVCVLPVKYRGSVSFASMAVQVGLLAGLRKKRFDLAVNMRTIYSRSGAFKMRALLWAIGAGATAGRNTEGRGGFFDVSIDETRRAARYERDYDIELVERLGAKVDDLRIDLVITAADREAASGLLSAAGISGGDILVGIHPGGKPSRRLAPERFAKAATILNRRLGCKFILTGDASEKALAADIRRMSGIEMADAAGALPLGATAAVIERCGLYISNDTANMHIAAILQRPLVAIFGPGDVTRFDPRIISGRAAVIYDPVDCAPCERMSCPRMDCLANVSAGEIADAALGLLGVNTK